MSEMDNDEATDSRRTMIHGFKKHIISDFLQDRHPYLYSPFNQRYDPKEVFHAVFDRSIPKLVEIVQMADLPAQSYKEAFMLLNEMASHQENKLTMIDAGLVAVCLSYMQHEDFEVRRDSTNLLGSLLSVRKGRERLDRCQIDPIFGPILLQDRLACREVFGWMLCRLCSGRDGVKSLIAKNQVKHVIDSFKKNSDDYEVEEAMFLIYLLECMSCILQTDEGIEQIVSTSVMKRFKEILSTEDQPFGEYDTRIKFLCLHCTSLIAMNDEGKEESIDLKMIQRSNKYLLHADPEVANAATKVIMFSSVHLEGKQEATPKENDEVVVNLISLLKHENKDIVRNAEIAIMNIADLPRGFMIICRYLCSHLDHLDRIFGPMAIIPLYSLLFKVDRPPFLTAENQEGYLKYALAIAYFVNAQTHKKEALNYAIEKTCKLVDRLLPLLLVKSQPEVQRSIASAVEKICEEDEVNLMSFQNFVAKHGEVFNELHGTTLLSEMAAFRELVELYQAREEAAKESPTAVNRQATL